MVLIFIGVLNRFHRFKFRVSPSQTAATSLSTMSDPNSPNIKSLDY